MAVVKFTGRPHHDVYLRYVFVTGVILAAIMACLPHVVNGKLRHGDDAYYFYQPFIGGIKFIVLQGVGISLSVIGLVASLTVLAAGLQAVPMTGWYGVGSSWQCR